MASCCGLRPVSDLLLTFIATFIFGSLVCLRFVAHVVLKGPKRMFCGRSRDVMPEVLNKPEFGTHQFVRLPKARVKLHYVVNGPTDKPLMLFIHGFPEIWYSWRHQLKEFSKEYRTIAFDMRGYGESDKPSGICQYMLDALVEDVDQLVTELGYGKFTLIGHDWGAVVAWGYGAVHPEKLEHLIICNVPHPTAMDVFAKRSFSQLLKSWYIFFFQLPVLPELFCLADDLQSLDEVLCKAPVGARQGTFQPEDIEAYKYSFAKFGDWTGPINFYRAVLRYANPQVDGAFRRGKIIVPTLIIWGTNDGALDKKMANLSASYVEQCTVHYIEGASHWVQQEEHEQVNMLIRQFMTKGDF